VKSTRTDTNRQAQNSANNQERHLCIYIQRYTYANCHLIKTNLDFSITVIQNCITG